VCVCYHFTAGHVSDQQREELHGNIKIGGMKLALTKATFTAAFDHVMFISQETKMWSREELESLCLEEKRTGCNYAAALSKYKAKAMKLFSLLRNGHSWRPSRSSTNIMRLRHHALLTSRESLCCMEKICNAHSNVLLSTSHLAG
jgi:hypothetical protein